MVESRILRDYHTSLNTDDHLYSGEELLADAANADALMITMQYQMSADLITRLTRSVQMIATLSVGFDHIDLNATEARGIAVTNAPERLLTPQLMLRCCSY